MRSKSEIRTYCEVRASCGCPAQNRGRSNFWVTRQINRGLACATRLHIRRMSHIVPPRSERDDPLSRMQAYRLARELLKDCWTDAEKTKHHETTQKVSAQLYAAIGSIAANLAEGYSRSSGKDRARIFEYALGSVRESMTWYYAAEPVLGENVVNERLDKLEQIRRLLLAIIPRERNHLVRPASSESDPAHGSQ